MALGKLLLSQRHSIYQNFLKYAEVKPRKEGLYT